MAITKYSNSATTDKLKTPVKINGIDFDGSEDIEIIGGGSGGVNYTQSSTEPLDPKLGDEWFDLNNGVLYKRVSDGASHIWLDISGASYSNIIGLKYVWEDETSRNSQVEMIKGNQGFQKDTYTVYEYGDDGWFELYKTSPDTVGGGAGLTPDDQAKLDKIETIETKIENIEEDLTEIYTKDDINSLLQDTNVEGLSTLSSPTLNVETLTEFRHPVSGKPIYTKTIDFGSLPNNTAKLVAHGVVDTEDIWIDDSRSYVKHDSSFYSVIHPDPRNLSSSWMAVTGGVNVNITTGSDRTTMTATVTILYTKTTDTSESPVRKVAGEDGIDGTDGKSAYELYIDSVSEGDTPLSELEWLESLKGKDGEPGTGTSVDLSNISGDILPDITQTYNIGSPEKRFKGIYVDEAHLSTNTLYIGDTPILGTQADNIVIKADPNQSLLVKTSGLGTTLFESAAGITANTSGVNADIKFQAQGTNSKVRFQGQGGIEFGSDVNVQENLTISKNLTINGNVNISGEQFLINAETVTTKDNIITLNYGEIGSGVTSGRAGIQIDRGENADFLLVFDETDDKFKVGQAGGDLEILASREWVETKLSQTENDINNSIDLIDSTVNDLTVSISKFITYTESLIAPENPNLGDEWRDKSNGKLYKWSNVDDGTKWSEIGAGSSSGGSSGGLNPDEDIILSAGKGVVMTSENGTKYKLYIDNDGRITTEAI